ncbi:MAG TPA: agmatine deiminase family protein [Polyangia bacterium]
MSETNPRRGTRPADGFAMPAEWTTHEATWLAFPHRASDWPGKLSAVRWVYGEIVRKIAAAERVELLVEGAKGSADATAVLRAAGVDMSKVALRRWPTDRSWIRDFGPIFVRRAGDRPEVAVARFRFNGWAKYPQHRLDDAVSRRAARSLRLRSHDAQPRRAGASRGVVLEGGSIDVNGQGTILTTEECLLDPEVQVRNPGFTRTDWEGVFRDSLGAGHTIWLARGIVGDDTHGHIDDLARFVDPTTIVLCQETNEADENHRILEENRERLEQARLQDGRRPDVIRLPMPAPLFFRGQRLPASYANFYICNAGVLVPTFNDPYDRVALGVLAELLPGRPVVGIHAVDLVLGLGTLHCLSQQQPAL